MSCKIKTHKIKRLSEELGANTNTVNSEVKREHLTNLVKNKGVEKLTFVLPHGQKVEKRVTYSSSFGLCEYLPRSRRRFESLTYELIRKSLDVEWKEPQTEISSERDRIRHSTLELLSVAEKIANAIKKYKHPNLDIIGWELLTELDYEQLAEQITADVLEQYDQYLQKEEEKKIKGEAKDFFYIRNAFCQALKARFGKKIRAFSLPVEYKLITLTSYRPKSYRLNKQAFIEKYIQEIKRHLDNKETFMTGWSSNYDVGITIEKSEDGLYWGSVSLEYKGLGNGHYYVLLDENHALWVEDD